MSSYDTSTLVLQAVAIVTLTSETVYLLQPYEQYTFILPFGFMTFSSLTGNMQLISSRIHHCLPKLRISLNEHQRLYSVDSVCHMQTTEEIPQNDSVMISKHFLWTTEDISDTPHVPDVKCSMYVWLNDFEQRK